MITWTYKTIAFGNIKSKLPNEWINKNKQQSKNGQIKRIANK